jgi:hypothetical protein
MTQKLIKNIDYYLDSNGNLVFTREYHLKRGHCCKSGCLNCPYDELLDPHTPQEFTSNWSDSEIEIDDDNDDDL